MRCALWVYRSTLAMTLLAVVLVPLPAPVAAADCVGDCNADGEVTVDELILMVNGALGTSPVSSCPAGDQDADGEVTINEIVAGVNSALNGCTVAVTPEATPTATATATPTSGSTQGYAGDYHGTASDGTVAVRVHVDADGSASGFLDFLDGGGAAATAPSAGGGASVVFSAAASGQANLSTGELQLSGTNAGSRFDITGQLPNGADAAGTFSVTLFETTYAGSLIAGMAPLTPTATPTPMQGCVGADLQLAFSDVSAIFNGDSSSFVATRTDLALEQRAPDYIGGLHETYNSSFNVSSCTAARNVQISIFGVLGGLSGGQSFSLVSGPEGSQAIIYYGQEAASGDSVWSSSAGTVVIDAVQGSVVSLRVVGAAMTQPAGAAAGSFVLDVTGEVSNFTRQE